MRGQGGIGADNELLARERIAFVERNLPLRRGCVGVPDFWHDAEVRRLLIAERNFLTLDMARAKVLGLYGPRRAPSRSAIGRFWQAIDQLEKRR